MLNYDRSLGDTVEFPLGLNDTAGSGDDGSGYLFDVRLVGAASSAAPVFSGSGTLLSDAAYPNGCVYASIAATSGNGFAANQYYLVYATATADGQTPTAAVGAFSTFGTMSAQISSGLEAFMETSGLRVASDTIGSTGNTTTTLHLPNTDHADDVLSNLVGMLRDVSTGINHPFVSTDWDNATNLLTIATPLTITPEDSVDTVVLLTNTPASASGGDATEAKQDTILANLATVDANVDLVLVDTGTTLPSSISALNDLSVADILTTQMTEAYAADGVAPTLAQAIFLIQQTIGDFAISGSTLITRELDGTTTAATYTLNDATNPTSRTRAT